MTEVLSSPGGEKEVKRQIVVNDDGKVIGFIMNNAFVKHVKASKHMLKTPSGWATDEKVIDYLVESGVEEIIIIDDETGKEYHSTIDDFLAFGFEINRGHGLQVCLPLKNWEVIDYRELNDSNTQLGH